MPQVQFLEPTPPEEDLILVSTVTSVEEYRDDPSRRDAVQVDLQLLQVRCLRPGAALCWSRMVCCAWPLVGGGRDTPVGSRPGQAEAPAHASSGHPQSWLTAGRPQVDSGPDGAQRERVFARGTGRFKKLGALRAM